MSSSAMETDNEELPVVLPSSTTSGLSISLHPLPILNVSEHLTRRKLQTNESAPFIIGALLGTQQGREVEIVNTFELAVEADGQTVDHGFLVSRRDQYKQVFPSLEFIGWYTVSSKPSPAHIALHTQFTAYCSTPLLLLLSSSSALSPAELPFKAYEPTIEIRDRASRAVFVEAPYAVETGEAERIAVDWTARGGGSGTSLESHLQTQRAAVKMLYDRIVVLVQYVSQALDGSTKKDHSVLRSIAALIASLPASENRAFREEFDTEYEDVQITAFLSSLTKTTNMLNDIVDKHILITSSKDERMGVRRRPGGAMGMGMAGGRYSRDAEWH